MAQEPKIIIKKNGPYIIYGKIPLIEELTNKDLNEKDITMICRCGHSEHKPFCDGSHIKNNWKDE